MTDFIKTQNSFSHGEVAPEFYSYDNINGLSHLENMDVLSGGGLTRRAGLKCVAQLKSQARIISFSVSNNEEYIIALTNKHMYIYRDNVHVQDIITPWQYEDLSNLQFAQRFGTMIFVHPNYRPNVLKKTGTIFELSDFVFSRNDSDMTMNIPFVKFDDASDVRITVTKNDAGNNFATFTTNKNFWKPENVDGRLYVLNRQWLVTQYIDSKTIVAYTNGSYTTPDAAVLDWYEAAFSARRGWPCSITFHQDRLVFGGSRDWPGGIWMSCVGIHNNFNAGTGLDDEAIFVSLLSQQRQQICTVVSSDNLQILTNVGEWAISSKPLTPSTVDIKQHTSVGSVSSCYLPPQKIEGSTVFISKNGRDIRELCLDELGEKYNANDLCAFAKHLMNSPVDIAYNDATKQLFVVLADGTMAVLNQNAALGISAWGRYVTSGQFRSVAVSGGNTYIVVTRDNINYLECFDIKCMSDVDKYDISFIASSLPLRVSHHNARSIKLRKIVARLLHSKSIYINNHRLTLPNEIYSPESDGFTGDISMNLLGTSHDAIAPIWTIHGNEPYPLTVLSISIHGTYNI